MQERMLQTQQQALDRLAVIHGRIQAILTQTYELHEYSIPRLFIILPKNTSEWNPASLLNNQFQLYFLCECGEHTKELNGDSTNISHHIHIAKHEGYDLQRPTEFFQKYGRYMLTLLEMIKHGSTVTGYIVPALSSVNASGAIDMFSNSQDTVTPSGINQSIEYLQSISSEQDAAKDTSTGSSSGREALGGVDLHHLEVFIKSKGQDQALGNLYRTITEEGHVKWVCIDHYRLAYKEQDQQDQQAFAPAVELNGGHYDQHLGRVTVSLGSKIRAAGFFEALAKARHLDELVVVFDWDGTTSDFEIFGDTLNSTAISILRLDIRRFGTNLASKWDSKYTRQQALGGCINHTSVKMIHIIVPIDLVELSNLNPKRLSLPPKLYFELVPRQREVKEHGRRELKRLVGAPKANSTLTTLDLIRNSIGDTGVVALSEVLKINSTLTILDLKNNSIGVGRAVALSEALKTNSTLTTLNLINNSIGVNGAVALSEALKTNSTLTTLDLTKNSIRDGGAVALSEALKTNSTLTTLDLTKNSIRDGGAVALSEALKTNSTLTTLNLIKNSIKEEGVVALSEALKINSTLITLDSTSNSIKGYKATVLFEALKINSTLTSLKSKRRSIGMSGTMALFKALKTNSTLAILQLTSKSMERNGVV
ncbi:hypothetical protein BGX24_012518, partial [Mortierella sp. AD032]